MSVQLSPLGHPGPVQVPGDLFARHQTIAGLRALADFLEANPGVPVETYGWNLTHHTRKRGDIAERAEVERIAALLGEIPVDDTQRGGHLVVSKSFGLIRYRVVHIPQRRMEQVRAQDRLRNSTRTDTGNA